MTVFEPLRWLSRRTLLREETPSVFFSPPYSRLGSTVGAYPWASVGNSYPDHLALGPRCREKGPRAHRGLIQAGKAARHAAWGDAKWEVIVVSFALLWVLKRGSSIAFPPETDVVFCFGEKVKTQEEQSQQELILSFCSQPRLVLGTVCLRRDSPSHPCGVWMGTGCPMPWHPSSGHGWFLLCAFSSLGR